MSILGIPNFNLYTMGLPLLVGSLLIALGPSAIFFITTMSRRPYLLVVSLIGLFMGIISMLIGGIIYSIWNIWAKPIDWVILAINILVLEVLRPFVYKLLVKICVLLNAVTIPLSISMPTELFKLSVSIGMGVGFLNVLSISLVPLTSSVYNADYYIPQCDAISIYVLTAFQSLFIMPMHVLWTYLTLQSFPVGYGVKAAIVAIWHLLIGFTSLLNHVHNGCIYTLVIYGISGIASLIILIKLVAGSVHLMKPSKKQA